MHTVRVLLWLVTSQFYPYPSALLPWHWDNHNASYTSLKNAGKPHKSATTSQADVDALVQNWGNSIDNIHWSDHSHVLSHWYYIDSGMILGLRPANERRCYSVTTSLIGWAQA